MDGLNSRGGIAEFLSQWLLDFTIGMYVYTYPITRDRVDFVINRPLNFTVSEVINNHDVVDLFIDLEGVHGNVSESECRESVVYVVRKIGLDSIELCNKIRRILRCRECAVLGLKDADAVAYQIAVLRECRALNQRVSFERGNTTFSAHLWLCGKFNVASIKNRFRISIEPLSQNFAKVLSDRMEMLRGYGYIVLNFFGYQRFGTRRPITHLIGKKLVYRDWEGFIETLCGYPFPTESRKSIASRLLWYSGRGWRLYPRNSIENRVCSEDIGRPLEVIRRIPKSMLQLYLNAYQSYLFNVVLSRVWMNLVSRYDLRSALAIVGKDLQYLPVPGASIVISSELVREVLEEVLGTEDVELRDFCIEELNLCAHGSYRRSYLTVNDISYSISDNLIRLIFTLESGCYATVVLREIFNTNPLLYV